MSGLYESATAARPRLEGAVLLFSHHSGQPVALRLVVVVVVVGDHQFIDIAILDHHPNPEAC